MKSKITIFLIALLALASCTDIIEPTLAKDKVDILTPQDTAFETYRVNFTWEEVKNALEYRVKIVEVDSVTMLDYDIPLDTTVKSNSYAYVFEPGIYKVYIRAQNSSSFTDWAVKHVQIKEGSFSDRIITLTSPTENMVYNTINALPLNFSLSWKAIPKEKNVKYKVLMDTSTEFLTADRFINKTITETSVSYKVTKDATYYWKVQAIKYTNNIATDSTQWSDLRVFITDFTTPPAVVTPVPTSGAVDAERKGVLKWTPSSENNVSYLVTLTYGSGATPEPVITTSIPQVNYDNNKATLKDVYWTVDVKDAAGNITKGTQWSFTTK